MITRVSLVLLILSLIVAAVFWLISLEFSTPVMIFISASFLFLVVYLFCNRSQLMDLLKTRKARYSSKSLIYTIIIIGILVIINLLGLKHNFVKDLTEEKIFTLSGESLKILDGLDKTIEIKAFFTDSHEGKSFAKHLLDQFEYESELIDVGFYDPDLYPSLANSYSISDDGTMVFELSGRSIQGTELSEQGIISGIMKVLSEKEKKKKSRNYMRNRSCKESLKFP